MPRMDDLRARQELIRAIHRDRAQWVRAGAVWRERVATVQRTWRLTRRHPLAGIIAAVAAGWAWAQRNPAKPANSAGDEDATHSWWDSLWSLITSWRNHDTEDEG